MRILDRHTLTSFVTALVPAVAVILFVMLVGALFRITDLIARGAPWPKVAVIFLLNIPQSLTYSIPMGTIASTLLVFGRLSADGEITGMRCCGISLMRISRPVILCGLILTALCLFIHDWAVPFGHNRSRQYVSSLRHEMVGSRMLEDGRFIEDFPGLSFYIGHKDGDRLSDIRIYDLREGQEREIRAQSGTVVQKEDGVIELDLRDVRIDPFIQGQPGVGFCARWTQRLNLANPTGEYKPKGVDMPVPELIAHIRNPSAYVPYLKGDDLALQRSKWRVEYHTRLGLSLACLAFVLLGIPLGVQAHRKESSIGIAMSLGVVFVFYLFFVAADSLASRPAIYPHLIVWIPVVGCVVLGLWLVRRSG